jgi:hypothetical protein
VGSTIFGSAAFGRQCVGRIFQGYAIAFPER